LNIVQAAPNLGRRFSELQIQVSKSNYRTWLEKTNGLEYRASVRYWVPNTFVAEYLDKNQAL